GRLADPNGANNPLCQVLYGLALRHGWGITPSADAAIHYLSLAASNSAAIESAALSSGSKAGGEAKGELVLAIFELANCFRYGWGIKVDKVAARNYYEVAANLGDPDALEEAAWCYMEGFGGPKDKFKAAQYLRLAEGAGRKSVGNSWIWKDKYSSLTK
ncbi:HCP-like protein, partial [Aureobasidium melanogenum]